MKKPTLWISPLTLSVFVTLVQSAQAAGPTVTPATRHDTSAALRDLASAPDYAEGHREQALIAQRTREGFVSNQPDSVAAQPSAALTGVSTVTSFDGQSAQDNRNVLGFAFVPPDTNGAVGARQYVQMVNVTIAVYDKRTGALQLGPVPIHTLWKGLEDRANRPATEPRGTRSNSGRSISGGTTSVTKARVGCLRTASTSASSS